MNHDDEFAMNYLSSNNQTIEEEGIEAENDSSIQANHLENDPLLEIIRRVKINNQLSNFEVDEIIQDID